MTQENKIIKRATKVCDLCDEVGQVEAVEMLPGGGILFECHHDNGKMHEWSAYDGFENIRNIKADREHTPEILCPQCNTKGIIKTQRDDNRRPDRYSYRISHPDGSRCFIRKENRDVVLKALGRYIEPSQAPVPIQSHNTVSSNDEMQQQQQQRQQSQQEEHKTRKRRQHLEQIVCPFCGKIGGAALYNNCYIVVHQHGDGKNDQHFMRSIEHKIRFLKSTTSNTLNTFRKQELEKSIQRELIKELMKYIQSQQADADRLLKIGRELYGDGDKGNE